MRTLMFWGLGLLAFGSQYAPAAPCTCGKLWRIVRTGRAVSLAALLLGVFLASWTTAAQAQSTDSATSASAARPDQGKVLLRIMAFAHAPVVGADVQVSVHGRLLIEAKAATNKYGVFVAPVWRTWLHNEEAEDTNAPERHRQSLLRISISGGTIEGQPFPWHLSADLAVADPAHQIVVVNPVTTLVSRLLDRRPELALDQAEARVRRFLTLPANYPLGQALRQGPQYRCRFFSPAAFMAEAQAAGGLEAFAHLLLQELASGLTHSFRPPNLLGSNTSTATSLVQAGMEAAVLDYAGANNVANLTGWAISLSGLSSGASSDIEALEQELQEIVSLIENLSYEVAQLTNLVQSTATQTQYIEITTVASAYATTIQKHENDLEYYSNACPPLPAGSPLTPPDPTCATLYNNLLSELQLEDQGAYYELVQNYVRDNGTLGTSGMLHLYSLWLAETRSFFRAADSTKMQNLYDYWDSILTAAANLRMEYYHLQGLQNGPAGRGKLTGFMGDPTQNPPTTGTFQTNEAANLKLMFPPVPAGTVVSTQDHTMWSINPWVIGTSNLYNPAPSCNILWEPLSVYAVKAPTPVYAGFFNWEWTPTLAQWQAAVALAPSLSSGTAWGDWLTEQTQTGPDESPASPGFFNATKVCASVFNGALYGAWSSTSSNTNTWWYINPYNNSFRTVGMGSNFGYNWPARSLANTVALAAEQYFWYN